MYIISNFILVSVPLGKLSKMLDTNNFVRVAHKNHEQKLDLLPPSEVKKCNYTNEDTTVTYYSTGCQTLYREQSAQTRTNSSNFYHIFESMERAHEQNINSQQRYKNIKLSDSIKTSDILRLIKWEEWLTHERNFEIDQMARQKAIEYMLKARTRKNTQTSDEIIEEAIATQMQSKNYHLKNIT